MSAPPALLPGEVAAKRARTCTKERAPGGTLSWPLGAASAAATVHRPSAPAACTTPRPPPGSCTTTPCHSAQSWPSSPVRAASLVGGGYSDLNRAQLHADSLVRDAAARTTPSLAAACACPATAPSEGPQRLRAQPAWSGTDTAVRSSAVRSTASVAFRQLHGHALPERADAALAACAHARPATAKQRSGVKAGLDMVLKNFAAATLCHGAAGKVMRRARFVLVQN